MRAIASSRGTLFARVRVLEAGDAALLCQVVTDCSTLLSTNPAPRRYSGSRQCLLTAKAAGCPAQAAAGAFVKGPEAAGARPHCSQCHVIEPILFHAARASSRDGRQQCSSPLQACPHNVCGGIMQLATATVPEANQGRAETLLEQETLLRYGWAFLATHAGAGASHADSVPTNKKQLVVTAHGCRAATAETNCPACWLRTAAAANTQAALCGSAYQLCSDSQEGRFPCDLAPRLQLAAQRFVRQQSQALSGRAHATAASQTS
jgi:hypothetical protein